MDPYLNCFWGPRPATPEQSAAQLSTMLSALAAAAPELAAWHAGATEAEALASQLDTSPAGLERVLAASLSHSSATGKPLPERGWATWAWDGREPGCTFRARIGGHDELARSKNSFLLTMDPALCRRLIARGRAHSLLRSLVATWSPSYGAWGDIDLGVDLPSKAGEPLPGWLTYLQGVHLDRLQHGTVHPAPDGVYIQATPRMEDLTLEHLTALQAELRALDALRPIAS